MSKYFSICDKLSGGAVKIPIEEAATQTYAFIARRDAGKTYGAGRLAEGMLEASIQVVVLDPIGVWWGLRLEADGKRTAYDIPIFGGLRGDVPLEPGSGAMVANLIVERNISMILDVSMFRPRELRQFATGFGIELYHRKKDQRSPLHLILEEAETFVPEGKASDSDDMTGAYAAISKWGRNYGIGNTLIGQRPQSINKNTLNQTEALFAMQISGSQEREALRKWIVEKIDKDHVSLVDDLPGLERGQAYLWSPSWLRLLEKVQIREKHTFNSSATPKHGAKRINPQPLSKADFAAVRESMKEVVERAEASDPNKLRTRLAESEKKAAGFLNQIRLLEDATAKHVCKGATATITVPVLDKKQIDAIGDASAKLVNFGAKWAADSAPLVAALNKMAADFGAAVREGLRMAHEAGIEAALAGKARQAAPAALALPSRIVTNDPAAVPKMRKLLSSDFKPTNADTWPLGKGEQATMIALAQLPNGADRAQLTVLTRYKRSTRDAYIQRLLAQGFAHVNGSRIHPTPEGIAALGNFQPLPTGQALQEHWLARLPKGEAAILEILITAYPDFVARAALDEPTGQKRSTRDAYLQRLTAKCLIQVNGSSVAASERLF
jgi:hypothetical protein